MYANKMEIKRVWKQVKDGTQGLLLNKGLLYLEKKLFLRHLLGVSIYWTEDQRMHMANYPLKYVSTVKYSRLSIYNTVLIVYYIEYSIFLYVLHV